MRAPTNTQGPRYAPCTHTSPFPQVRAVQHPTHGHCKAGRWWSLLPSPPGLIIPLLLKHIRKCSIRPIRNHTTITGSDTRKSGRYICCCWRDNDNAADSNDAWVGGCMQPGSERAVHCDAVHDNNVRRGDSVQTTTRSKTWLSGARYLICGGGGSG